MAQPSVRPRSLKNQRSLSVIRPGQIEAVNEDLYDFQTYALAGTTSSYRFFTTQLGSGGKTLADTNMELSGQLSSGIEFIVRGIEIPFFPGVLPSPIATASTVALGQSNFVNDVWTIFRQGYMVLTVLAKPYLRIAPLGRMPFSQRLHLNGWQTDSTTAGATQLNKTNYAAAGGAAFAVTPFKLTSNMNFDVSLFFPTVAALPSGVDGRIGVILRGIKQRVSQ